ncbi:hypothetical protein Y032_0050g2048 [Ancylostoma ceylanicum]|uniref:Uncharacterized protein n=1 Tax=Ancylostoma ceylanicum TaxID=53326 RepID=A0A016UA13_9BILA|nr:hypothetical protein Y032_0050g2048 [Ancylostoma ceylanicum]
MALARMFIRLNAFSKTTSGADVFLRHPSHLLRFFSLCARTVFQRSLSQFSTAQPLRNLTGINSATAHPCAIVEDASEPLTMSN